jgi:hypothetical protein
MGYIQQEIPMSTQFSTAIEAAIQNLQAQLPRPRGRKRELAPYVAQLRELIASGWTRAEIIAEIRALGAKVSPTLLRDVLYIDSADQKKVSKKRRSNHSFHPLSRDISQ